MMPILVCPNSWKKVSKIVVIAREIVEMAKRKAWDDVRPLSFDLQIVEFVYAKVRHKEH